MQLMRKLIEKRIPEGQERITKLWLIKKDPFVVQRRDLYTISLCK